MVVVGSGAAGHHGAIQAAKLGKKIADGNNVAVLVCVPESRHSLSDSSNS